MSHLFSRLGALSAALVIIHCGSAPAEASDLPPPPTLPPVPTLQQEAGPADASSSDAIDEPVVNDAQLAVCSDAATWATCAEQLAQCGWMPVWCYSD